MSSHVIKHFLMPNEGSILIAKGSSTRKIKISNHDNVSGEIKIKSKTYTFVFKEIYFRKNKKT